MEKKVSSSSFIPGVILFLLFFTSYKLMGESLLSSLFLAFLGGLSGGFISHWWNQTTPPQSIEIPPSDKDLIVPPDSPDFINNQDIDFYQRNPQTFDLNYLENQRRKRKNQKSHSVQTLSLVGWLFKPNKERRRGRSSSR